MIRFHETIKTAYQILSSRLNSDQFRAIAVRDLQGCVSIIMDDDQFPDSAIAAGIAAQLHSKLGRYSAGPDEIFLRESNLLDPTDIVGSEDLVDLPAYPGLRLLDRLLTNQDWIRKPLQNKPPIPTIVAFSIKGGVGRSTALAVLAWQLARNGRRVVVVDLDLESPGVASIFLENYPEYGLVDWLVDRAGPEPDPRLLQECLMRAPISDECNASIRILPAAGEKTQDYIAQLSRCYLHSFTEEGADYGFAEKLRDLLGSIANLADEKPDVILIDSRAGLHDIGAAAVTRLAAEVLFFGRDERQSWQAYGRLFQTLQVARSIQWGMPDEDLRWRLKMIAAQVRDRSEGAKQTWISNSYSEWLNLYDDESKGDEASSFGPDESVAPHFPAFIYYGDAATDLNLANKDRRPVWESIQPLFDEFLTVSINRLFESI
jgi:cellulose biosynthesis protein BcsQ